MDVFGRSVSTRYLQLCEIMKKDGCDVATAQAKLLADREEYVEDELDDYPEKHPYMDAFNETLGGNSYGGDYIIDIAREFYEADGDKWVEADAAERDNAFRETAYQKMLQTSQVDRAFKRLEDMGYLYKTDDGALWFKSTEFGDDKDRVLIKSNGEYTYFASDVAYHWNKFARGAEYSIDLWGADHHGYIARVTNVCDALGFPGKFEVDLGQFVNLLRNGEPVRMSKRRGTMVSFQELLDEVGVDATRYTLISKSANQTIDFDIEAAKKQEASNPVFYVQYAHARRRQGHRLRVRRGASDRRLRGRARPQALRVPRARRQLRPRPRPLPPHALLRGAGFVLPQLLPALPGPAERGPSRRPRTLPRPPRGHRRRPHQSRGRPRPDRRLRPQGHVRGGHPSAITRPRAALTRVPNASVRALPDCRGRPFHSCL